MKIKKVDHINIVVNDIKKSIDFYTKVFEFIVKFQTNLNGEWFEGLTGKKDSLATCAFLEIPDCNYRIELLEYKNPKSKSRILKSKINSVGIRHIAFEVDNIQEVVERLEAFSKGMISNVVEVPLSILSRGKKLCYINAPDDVIIELAQYDMDD